MRLALVPSLALSLYLLGGLLRASNTSAQSADDKPAADQVSDNQPCPTCPPETQQTIYAPLFDLPDADGSELNLNCRSSHPMDVTPTFYTAEGTAVVGEVIHLLPAEIRFVNTKSLIPAAHRQQQRWAGMSLSYTGHYMEAWAQLTLHGFNHGGSVNVLFSVLNDKRSNTQAAVWWVPPGGAATLALGNSSAQSIHATLAFSDGDSQDVDIAPFTTELVRRRGNQRGGHSESKGVADSVIISSTGVPGSLIPTGLIGSADGKFTASTRFYDIQNGVQPHLFATRFRLKDVTPHLLLRNTTAAVVSAQPRFRPLAGESGDPVDLPFVTLGPNEAREVSLAPLAAAAAVRPDLKEVSVEVVNGGEAGSLVGALYGTDRITGAVYDVPLRDSGPMRVSTGGYPIRLDGDYSTIISITNVGDKGSEFTSYINYEGGRYILPLRRLSAGETAVFNVRELRDKRKPDAKGKTLPASVAVGQFRWSIHSGGARLLGRAEVVSRAERVTSSYSCTGCCPSSFAGASINPGSVIVLVDGFAPVGAEETDGDCYGNYWTFPAGIEEWYCNNASIAYVSGAAGNAQVEGVAPGLTGVWAEWPYEQYIYDGQDCRDYGPSTASAACDVDVVNIAKIQYQSGSTYTDISGTLYVLKGTSVTFKAVPSPANGQFPSGKPVWSGTSSATGTGDTVTVTFNTASTSLTNYKTVIATAGNSKTVNVVVFDLTPMLTAQDNFSGRSVTDYGLEELVDLNFTVSPSSLTAAQLGGLQWKIASGQGTLPPKTDGTGTYTAPQTAQAVTLKLEVLAGPSKGSGRTKPISVIAPADAYMTKVPGTNLLHYVNTWSVGFLGDIYLLPKNVSFKHLQFYESATTGVGSGWLSNYTGTPHPASTQLFSILSGNSSTGCRVNTNGDDAYSGKKSGPYGVGSWYWDIPWRYVTSTGTTGILFKVTRQLHTSDASGTATISKGSASFQRVPSDPTSTY